MTDVQTHFHVIDPEIPYPLDGADSVTSAKGSVPLLQDGWVRVGVVQVDVGFPIRIGLEEPDVQHLEHLLLGQKNKQIKCYRDILQDTRRIYSYVRTCV